MLDQAINDEPSMEGILAEVRRLILQDEAARRTPPVPQAGGKPILLTQMLAANGSIVNIARGTEAHAALGPMRTHDPFAKIESLQEEVAALLGPEPDGRRDAQAWAARGSRSDDCRDAPAGTVGLAGLALAPIVVDGARPAPPAEVCAAGELVIPMEAAPCRPVADGSDLRDPSEQIERMLAHQMAAAHEAAMMLTRAAVGQIRGANADSDEPLQQPRSRARARGRRRGGGDAARLADTAVRMMQAYNSALETLMAFGGDAAASIAARGKRVAPSMPTAAHAPKRARKPKRKRAAGRRPRGRPAIGPN